MRVAELWPTPNNTYRIIYSDNGEGVRCDFGHALSQSRTQESEGDIEKACNTRFGAFQRLMELIPDSAEVELEWDDQNSRDAMLLLNCSAIDHFLAGDFEMSAAMLEMLLELDPEDHLEASKLLAYAYAALGEWELFDEVVNDIGDKCADKGVLALWSGFLRHGTIPEGELRHFKRAFGAYHSEFVAHEHPAHEEYVRDIESENPSREALARELWLRTEHLWALFPGFIEALRDKS